MKHPAIETTANPDSAGGGPGAERVRFDFGAQFDSKMSRRSFTRLLGSGLLISVPAVRFLAQESGRAAPGGLWGTGAQNIAARIHLGTDGSITVMSGKVECGQGSRAELSQAAAQELGVSAGSIQMILADTSAVPNDGITAGSRTTPTTIPAVRRGAAAARGLLIAYAGREWKVEQAAIEIRGGKAIHRDGSRSMTYADLARSPEAATLLGQAIPEDIAVTPVKDWDVMGTSVLRPNGLEIVTGQHRYPSDVALPGMLYGKILRPPAFGARLTAIDLAPAKAMPGVVVVQDNQFVGVAAATTFRARAALAAIAGTAKWEKSPDFQPASDGLSEYLQRNVEGGVRPNPFAAELHGAKSLSRTYNVPYIQHAPMEPRAAVAQWSDGGLTVWTGTQNPFGIRSELADTFQLPQERVRVVIPDFGGAFGGKHTGEYAIEAARLARAAGKPVSLRWTREEEFTWAYFRPAGVITAEASLDVRGKIATWYFVNVNSGPNAVMTPYSIEKNSCLYLASKPPLRHGSYRGLAATANNFAREVFMDELAAAAGSDPLEFRLAHLEADRSESDARLRAVLVKAATEFRWKPRAAAKQGDVAVGLACGTEKGSYVAACVAVEILRAENRIKVLEVCEAYECGAIVNPGNLLSQVQGAIIMGLGAVLREHMEFQDGKILNGTFSKYRVPRFSDVPKLDIHLVNRPDLPSAGAGETPIIALAPAVANAVFRATGKSVGAIPVTLPEA